jgi:hypothetical protein
MTSSEGLAPDACTLPTAQQPRRLAEFDDLFATALRDINRVGETHLRLSLAGPESLRPKVEDLAARETECCSFFAFTVTAPAPGRVQLDIEVPTAHIEVLDALANRAGMVPGQ